MRPGTVEPPAESLREPSLMGPLAFWLLVQVLGLTAGAFGVQFSDDFPRPGHSLAFVELLIVQITAVALLFPVLCAAFSSAVVLAGSTWPFLLLTAVLSSQPSRNILLAGLYVNGWIIGMGLLAQALRSEAAKLIGIALAGLLALGGPALWYLNAEFVAAGAPTDWATWSLAGPIMGVISILQHSTSATRAWGEVGGVVAAGAAAWLLRMGVAWRNRDSNGAV